MKNNIYIKIKHRFLKIICKQKVIAHVLKRNTRSFWASTVLFEKTFDNTDKCMKRVLYGTVFSVINPTYNTAKTLPETYIKQEKMGAVKAIRHFVLYAIAGIKKYKNQTA